MKVVMIQVRLIVLIRGDLGLNFYLITTGGAPIDVIKKYIESQGLK